MESVVKSDIFFFVSSIAVIIITIFIVISFIKVIRIANVTEQLIKDAQAKLSKLNTLKKFIQSFLIKKK